MNERTITVYSERSRWTLDPVQDYIFEGGFGKIYAQGTIAFKIMKDAQHLLPTKKFDCLAKLDGQHIVKPLEYIFSDARKSQAFGITMKYLPKDQYFTLLRVMTNTFWKKHGMTTEKATKLFMAIVDTAVNIATNKCYMPDPNPGNFLVNDALFHHVIDVDSFGTPGFPSKMVAPGVMDFSQKEPGEKSMWYGLAIIGFQLFIGVHPFLDGVDPKGNDLEKRFRGKRSVLVPEIKKTLNRNTRDFAMIPTNLMDWFTKTFHEGTRAAPGKTIIPAPATVSKKKPEATYRRTVQAKGLSIERLIKFKEKVERFYKTGNIYVACVGNKLHLFDTNLQIIGTYDDFLAAFMIDGETMLAKTAYENLDLYEFNVNGNHAQRMSLQGGNIFSEQGALFSQGNFYSIEVIRLGKLAIALRQITGYLPKSTNVFQFESIAIQHLFDANTVYHHDGTIKTVNVDIPKSEKIVNALAKQGVFMIESSDRNGKRILRLFSGGNAPIVDAGNKIVTTLATVGERIFFIEDGKLCLIKKDFSERTDFESDFFDSDVTLCGEKALFAIKANEIFKISNK